LSDQIVVSNFDDETKEEELNAHFYRLVYGGGTRDVNDGKVQSCQIFSLPSPNPKEPKRRFALITFDSKELADLAMIMSCALDFKGRYLSTESASTSQALKVFQELKSKDKAKEEE